MPTITILEYSNQGEGPSRVTGREDGGAEMADGETREDELERTTEELVGLLSGKARGWAEIYLLMARVEDAALWEAAYPSMTKWVEDLARRARVQVQYLWRVKKAGRFYSAYLSRNPGAPPMDEVRIGDEMLADLDRISEGSAERADAYVESALRGEITKRRVKEIVRATAESRKAARGDRGPAGGGRGASPAPQGPTATDVIAAIGPEALFGGDERLERRLLRGERRVFQVLGEFPCGCATSDHPRRIDAVVVTNIDTGPGARGLPGCPQDAVTLHGIEVKVSPGDLRRDAKHVEYEPYCDYLWMAMPASLYSAMREDSDGWLSDGWGVLVLGDDGVMSVAVPARRNGNATMREVAMATALVRLARPLSGPPHDTQSDLGES